jgi:hypothetical protein
VSPRRMVHLRITTYGEGSGSVECVSTSMPESAAYLIINKVSEEKRPNQNILVELSNLPWEVM